MIEEEIKEDTKIKNQETKIDMDLYNRQIGVYGMET